VPDLCRDDVWNREAACQRLVNIHTVGKNDLLGRERLQADLCETREANEQAACPFGAFAHLALEPMEGVCVGLRAMPLPLKQVGVAIQLKRTIDLLANDREAATLIHTPGIEKVREQRLEMAAAGVGLIRHLRKGKEARLKALQHGFVRAKRPAARFVISSRRRPLPARSSQEKRHPADPRSRSIADAHWISAIVPGNCHKVIFTSGVLMMASNPPDTSSSPAKA
jgi:hypothetical protein